MSMKCTELYWVIFSLEPESITWEKLELNIEPETHQTYSFIKHSVFNHPYQPALMLQMC